MKLITPMISNISVIGITLAICALEVLVVVVDILVVVGTVVFGTVVVVSTVVVVAGLGTSHSLQNLAMFELSPFCNIMHNIFLCIPKKILN